jgi:hypothetical protein
MLVVNANAGVPMLSLHLPLMIKMLAPIVLIEAAVGRYYVKMELLRSLRGVAGANVVSTFLGVPLAWGMMLALELITTGGGSHGLGDTWGILASTVLQAAWLVPYEKELSWMIPVASLVLLVPYFFVSVFSERLVLLRLWKDKPRSSVSQVAWIGNVITYGLLAAFALWQLFSAMRLRLEA